MHTQNSSSLHKMDCIVLHAVKHFRVYARLPYIFLLHKPLQTLKFIIVIKYWSAVSFQLIHAKIGYAAICLAIRYAVRIPENILWPVEFCMLMCVLFQSYLHYVTHVSFLWVFNFIKKFSLTFSCIGTRLLSKRLRKNVLNFLANVLYYKGLMSVCFQINSF